jgi:hypothetical protein
VQRFRFAATGSTSYICQGLDARIDEYPMMRASNTGLPPTDVTIRTEASCTQIQELAGSAEGGQMILIDCPDTFELFGVGPAFSPFASLSQGGVS